MYHRLLLATDLTQSSKAAASKAKELATQFDARLYIAHAVEPIPAYGYPGETDIQSPYIDHAREALANLGQECSVSASDQFILLGSTQAVIIKKAEELSVDLIIVGSHSHHGLARLLGSRANAILHAATCDVITVRC